MTTATPVLVIGGGVAGGAVAAELSRAGTRVVLLERKAGPHDKVCGEFISHEALLYLRDLDIDLEKLGAVEIAAVRFYTRDRMVAAPLPFRAFSLSRRVLDEAILRAAAAAGAEIRRGHAVQSLHQQGATWVAEVASDDPVCAADVFVATGKHDLRGWKRRSGRQDDFVAFKMHWRFGDAQAAALGSCVELFAFPGGYAGLEPVENGIANLCLTVRRRCLAELDHRWDLLLSTLRSRFLPLHERLTRATQCWDRPLAVTAMPYGYLRKECDGPWHLGDQAAVIPSFAGGGIAIALHSARLAAQCYLAGGDAAEFQSRFAADVAAQVRCATLLSRMLVSGRGQVVAMKIAHWLPGLLGTIARHTRIPVGSVAQARRPLLRQAGENAYSTPVRPTGT